MENKKRAKIQQAEILRLKSIKKEVNVEEEKRKERALKKEIEEKHRELFGTKRLAYTKYEEPELDLKLSDEIKGNLRNLVVKFNLSKFYLVYYFHKTKFCL